MIANSCIARRPENGSFRITGTDGLPNQPFNQVNGVFETYVIAPPTPNPDSDSQTSLKKRGNQIMEARGIYRLPNGQLVLGRECSH